MLRAFKKLKVEHQKLFALIIAIALIMFWRGVWGLLDVYLLPEAPGMSFLLSGVIGLVILLGCDVLMKSMV